MNCGIIIFFYHELKNLAKSKGVVGDAAFKNWRNPANRIAPRSYNIFDQPTTDDPGTVQIWSDAHERQSRLGMGAKRRKSKRKSKRRKLNNILLLRVKS